jgi:hypothetical protein
MLRKRTDHFKRDKLHNAQSRWRARGECITRLTPIRPPAATVIAMAGSASWKSSRLPLRCIRNPKQLLKIDLMHNSSLFYQSQIPTIFHDPAVVFLTFSIRRKAD